MLPEAFLKRMQEMLGEDYPAFVESYERDSHRALRINPLKEGENQRNAVEWLTNRVWECHPGRRVVWEENGYYYAQSDAPGRHPYHEAGLYYMQEPSAMAPATLLEVEPGEKVLDLCAAPGGKSTQLAARMGGEGLLVCNEIHPSRARILSENIERMGVSNACVTNETPGHLAEIFVEYFDRILVDAPCSGEGMFRKNEAASEEWSPENVALCAERQDEILDRAAQMLCPGGRLVYSTCTFAPAENEGSVSRFLERHQEFALVPADKSKLGLQDVDCDGVAAYVKDAAEGIEGTLRLWPHRVDGEGHFAAILQKQRAGAQKFHGISAGGFSDAEDWETFRKRKEMTDFLQFCDATLAANCRFLQKGRVLRFGEQLYLVPDDMPSLKGLKVLRPGLHLGTLKKNRFEPSHALALALSPAEVKHVWHLSAGEDAIGSYLNGQTLPAEGEKGWYLICVDGFGIGWGKLAGGMMKNHYPRGLRKN